MEAVGRKSGRKGRGKLGSGSGKKKKQYPVPEAQNLPMAAISRRENRKRLFEERRKEKDDEAKREEVGKGVVSFSGESEGFGKNTSDGPEPLLPIFGEVGLEIQGILGMAGDDAAWAAWQAAFNEPSIIPEAEKEESTEEWETRMRAQLAQLNEDEDEEGFSDYEAQRASYLRSDWEFLWSSNYGAFEDTTRIPPMRFTFRKPPRDAMRENALQIFSAKVTGTRDGLPFDVFGMVAIRDTIDHNRNIVFCRTRDNCQTLTKEHPYLVLTGPTRAVMLELTAPVIIEVDLTVKGTTDSEDEKLSSLAVPILSCDTIYSRMWKCAYTSKLSTVEFTLGHIVSSVEATIFVRVTRGSWTDGFHGQFSAVATGVCAKPPSTVYHSVNDEEIILLDSGGDKVLVTGDGDIKLSRRVVSVDMKGELKVYVKAWGGDNSFTKKCESFKPLEAGKSGGTIDIGFCAVDVTVFWSLILYHPVHANSAL